MIRKRLRLLSRLKPSAAQRRAAISFVLAHPAVTCVIPGTGNPAHMADNCAAGTGTLLDAALRKRIIAEWEAGN